MQHTMQLIWPIILGPYCCLLPSLFRSGRSRNRQLSTQFFTQERFMKLRPHEYCPIHRSLSCCRREASHRARILQPGVRRVEDPHHLRGYRELRSPAEMCKLLKRKVREQNGICAICHEEFTDYSDIVPDHRDPKEMGGEWTEPSRQYPGDTLVV